MLAFANNITGKTRTFLGSNETLACDLVATKLAWCYPWTNVSNAALDVGRCERRDARLSLCLAL